MQSGSGRKILMLMVDGFGVPPEGWRNSIIGRCCSPELVALLEHNSYPIDARLGVDGIPQSATGQAALFCGFNAPAVMGRHIHAFPGKKLRDLIRQDNIFRTVRSMDKKPVFANVYVRHSLDDLAGTRYRSVTTVMTASVLGWSFRGDDLRQGRGVFHDITNASCSKEYDIPVIAPEQAADNLLRLTGEYDFVLFEYFLTDHAGHTGDPEQVRAALAPLDRLIMALTAGLDDRLLLVTADHGNCEDLAVSTHTLNPVPLLLYGRDAEKFPRITDLTQVCGLIAAALR